MGLGGARSYPKDKINYAKGSTGIDVRLETMYAKLNCEE